ncbi:MAG: hypothetical protein U9N45_02770, partial [Gemmatimonadota bacterium]|nr:hypothetical protein [Gemmatimonadota bacterium]
GTEGYIITGLNLGKDTYGPIGKVFATPITLTVTSDDSAKGASGLQVYYSAIQGGGAWKNNQGTTNENGVASNTVTLGPEPGLNVFQASVVLPDGSVAKYIWHITGQIDPDVSGKTYWINTVPEVLDSMVARAGSPYPLPLVAVVRDSLLKKSPDRTVTFTVEEGGGSISVATATTNSDGIAQTVLTLGPSAGLNRVRATIIRGSGEACWVFFDVWGTTDVEAEVNSITMVSGNNQTGAPGGMLSDPIVLKVMDTAGEPVSGNPVTVVLTQGGGKIGAWGGLPEAAEVFSATTDNEGLVHLALRLGPGPVLKNEAKVMITKADGSVASVMITATAQSTAQGADSIAVISGVDQTTEVGSIAPLPIVVAVYDADGNLVPNASVSFTVTQGYGMIGKEGETPKTSFMSQVTNSEGLAVITWQLGPGPDLDNIVVAEIRRPDGSVRSVNLHVQALPTPDTASRLFITSGNYQGNEGEYKEGEELPLPLVVKVVDTTRTGVGGDIRGAPVSNFPVLFTAYGPEAAAVTPALSDEPNSEPSGTGRLEARTNEDGLASVRLTLGESFGKGGSIESYLHNHRVVAVTVFSDGSQDSVLFFATALPVAEIDTTSEVAAVVTTERIANVSGDGQTGSPEALLAEPVVVKLLDKDDKPVVGCVITIMVSKGGGAIGLWGELPEATEVFSAITNQDGVVRLAWRLGTSSELENEITASANKADGSVLSVRVTAAAIPSAEALGPDSIAVVSGADQSAEVGSILPLPVVIAVFDEAGNLLSDAEVYITISQGGGYVGLEGAVPQLVLMTGKTNSKGILPVSWKLGPGPDLDNSITVQVVRENGTQSSVTVNAQSKQIPDTANRLVITSGNYQSTDGVFPVWSMLPEPLVVKVVDTTRAGVEGDTLGAPIPNFSVLFTAYSPSGDASLGDDPNSEPVGTGRLQALTDQDGLAAVRWIMGTETGAPDDMNFLRFNNRCVAVAVFSDGSQDSVIFFATAVPLAPTRMNSAGGALLSGTAGKSLTGLDVVVQDEYFNAVGGVTVSYVIEQSPGSSTISEPVQLTNMFGVAGVTIDMLSTKTGQMKVSAINGFLMGSPITYIIDIVADEPAEFIIGGGDGQISTVGVAFDNGLKVYIFDQYSNPVPNVRVNYALTGGSAELSDVMKLTDGNGTVQISVKPLAEGAITVTASAIIDGAVQTLTFNLTGVVE